MHSCEACQNQLLEYVFDVLDDAERQALQAHLAELPGLPGGAGPDPGAAAPPGRRRPDGVSRRALRVRRPPTRVQPVPAPTVACPAVLPLPRRDPVRWRRWAAVAAAAPGRRRADGY